MLCEKNLYINFKDINLMTYFSTIFMYLNQIFKCRLRFKNEYKQLHKLNIKNKSYDIKNENCNYGYVRMKWR